MGRIRERSEDASHQLIVTSGFAGSKQLTNSTNFQRRCTSLRREGDRLLFCHFIELYILCKGLIVSIKLFGRWRVLDASPRASLNRQIQMQYIIGKNHLYSGEIFTPFSNASHTLFIIHLTFSISLFTSVFSNLKT